MPGYATDELTVFYESESFLSLALSPPAQASAWSQAFI